MRFDTLTDAKLAAARIELDREIRRRADITFVGDAWKAVRSQEMAKRALTVAAAGNHSILLVGSRGAGKSLLRAGAFELGFNAVFEAHPCPCGFRNDPRRACNCSSKQVERVMAKWPLTDMWIECPPVPGRELTSKLVGTGLATAREYIDRAAKHTSLALDTNGEHVMRTMVSDHGMSAERYAINLRVARTIANLDDSEHIRVQHVMEAVNYRHPAA